MDWDLPVILTNKIIKEKKRAIGISSGTATGILLNKEKLKSKEYANCNKILYTDVLSSDLAGYFDSICGIVSNSGGMLSHLAIMAREHLVPVVVNAKLDELNIRIGDLVEIDGDSGMIQKQEVEKSTTIH